MGTIYSKLNDWRRQLLDLSKRNRLISTKLGQRGVLEFERPTAESVWQQLVIDNASLTFVWKRDLLDDDFDEGTAGLSLYLEDEEPATNPLPSRKSLEDCLASPDLEAHHVLTRLTDRVLATRLNRLALNAKTSLDEQGVNILSAIPGQPAVSGDRTVGVCRRRVPQLSWLRTWGI